MEVLSTDYRENEDYCPSSYESNDNGWTWRKGLSWGKKMVVTGVVITSAPLFLPPFVALSVLGFVFLVPAGFAFVTYACTEKFVHGLLPMPYTDDTEKGYGQAEDERKEFEEDKGSEIGMRVGLKEGNNEIDVHKDEVDGGAKVHETVEESVYDQDATEYMEHEEQTLSSSAIPDIMAGIRKAEDEISSMKNEHGELPVDSLQAVVVAADLGGENEITVEQLLGEMSIIAPSHSKEENKHKENFANIDVDSKRQDRAAQETPKESEGLSVSDTSEDKGSGNISVIPEEVKPEREVISGSKSEAKSSSTVGTKQKANKKKSKGDKSGLAKEVNEKTYGGHTHTTTINIRQGTSSDRKAGTSILPSADEGGSDLAERRTMAPTKKPDVAERRPKGSSK